MKQVLVALVAMMAVVGLQTTADAVLVNVLIDDFSVPPGPAHTSTVAGSTLALTPGPPPMGPAAADRTLFGRPIMGLIPAALTAGAGGLDIALGSGEMAMVTWTLDAAFTMFALTDPNVVLAGLVAGAVPPSANLFVELLEDGLAVDSAIYVASEGLVDLNLMATGSPVSVLGLRFTADTLGTEGLFIGTADQVVANPEPATMVLMGLGVLGGAIGYRRRRKPNQVVPASAA